MAIVLADLAGGDWPQRARQAAAVLSARAEESNPIGSLLLDVWATVLEHPEKRIFTRDLLSILSARTGRPWYEARNGKEITDIWLAQQLKPYGIKSRTIWIGDHHAKGYTEADLLETCRRYISRTDLDALKADWAAQKKPAAPVAEPPQSNSLIE